MKKLTAVVLTMAMAFSVLAVAPEVKADKKIKVMISMTEGLDSSTYARTEEFGQKVNADCGDIFDFQIYPNDQLGSYDDVTAEAINGTVQMIVGGLSTKIDARGSIAYSPFLCTSLDSVEHDFGEGSFLYNLVTDIANGMDLTFLGFDVSGMEGLSIRGDLPENPLDPASDKKGMQIRTTGNAMMQNLMKELGYTPVTVAWNEVYSATQSGMINGFLGANAGSAYNQFRDIIDHYLPINFAVDANRIVVSNVFWNTLDDAQKASFTEHAKEIFLASIEKTKEETQGYFDKLKEAGVDVVELTQEDYDLLAGIAREKCWPTIIETYGQEVYDDMMAFYQK